MAGSWNVGANLRQIVVFRRGDDWRLLATMIDLQGGPARQAALPDGRNLALRFRRDHRAQVAILVADDFINLRLHPRPLRRVPHDHATDVHQAQHDLRLESGTAPSDRATACPQPGAASGTTTPDSLP